MNQILITEKFYVTPEVKKKKRLYKLEFFLSVFLVCLLFSYYIYAEYDRNKAEQASKDILSEIKYDEDLTIKRPEDDDVIVVVLNTREELEHRKEELKKQEKNKEKFDTKIYKAKDGIEYTTESILRIPSINLEYAVLSKTSSELLWISLNKYWGPSPNEIGNYCIVGHYYQSGKMFGKLHKLQNGDKAELIDPSGRVCTYQIYDKYIVEPEDTSCTTQMTNGKKELTLITCTNHGKQRLVLKLREV